MRKIIKETAPNGKDEDMMKYRPHPNTVVPQGLHKTFLCQYGPYQVFAVDGTYIRDNIYNDYVEGGNPGRYSFVPENEIWVEQNLSEEDRVATAVHEVRECELMKHKHESYDEAHDKANEFEHKVREAYRSKLDRAAILVRLNDVFKKG